MRRPFLIGERIYFRVLEESDITDDYIGWLDNPEIANHLKATGQFPTTATNTKKWLEKFHDSTTNLAFAIVDKSTDQHIGNITLYGIKWIPRRGEIGLMMGREAPSLQEYGTEVLSLLADYAFQRLGLNKVVHSSIADDIHRLQIAKNVGFREEVVFREQVYRDGQYHNLVIYGLLNNDFVRNGLISA